MEYSKRLFVLFLITCGISVSSEGQESPWKVRLSTQQKNALPGSYIYLTLEVTNISEQNVTVPMPFNTCSRFCGLGVEAPKPVDDESCDQRLGCGNSEWLSISKTKRTYAPGEVVTKSTDRFSPSCVGTYRFYFACDVPATVNQPDQDPKTKELVSNDDVWHGSLRSNAVSVQVLEPQGIDAEAYEEFNHHPLFSNHRDELLRRFPTCTYAGYVVWTSTSPGIIPSTVDSCLYAMERGAGNFQPTYLQCLDPTAQDCHISGYPPSGTEAARRQVQWIDMVLEHHPDIWFADELRFKRAYAAFHLGDETGFIAAMEHLSENGKPYVGDKARELLAALREKGLIQDSEAAEGDGK